MPLSPRPASGPRRILSQLLSYLPGRRKTESAVQENIEPDSVRPPPPGENRGKARLWEKQRKLQAALLFNEQERRRLFIGTFNLLLEPAADLRLKTQGLEGIIREVSAIAVNLGLIEIPDQQEKYNVADATLPSFQELKQINDDASAFLKKVMQAIDIAIEEDKLMLLGHVSNDGPTERGKELAAFLNNWEEEVAVIDNANPEQTKSARIRNERTESDHRKLVDFAMAARLQLQLQKWQEAWSIAHRPID